MLDNNSSPIILDELYDDEKLLWSGQPKPIRFVTGADWLSSFGGLFFIGFATIFLLTSNAMIGFGSGFGNNNDEFFTLFRIPFIIVPLIFIFTGLGTASAPIRKYMRATRTYYAVTNQRVLIITDLAKRQSESYFDEQIEFLERSTYRDGTGDILFTTRTQVRTRSSNSMNRSSKIYTNVKFGLRGVSDPRYVEDIMSQIFFADSDGKAKRKSNSK